METKIHKTVEETKNGVNTTTVNITFLDGVEVEREETISTWISKITKTTTKTSISDKIVTKKITKEEIIDHKIQST